MSMDYEKESGVFKALSHPVRLKIVEGLIDHECNVYKIVKALKLPQSTVSQHLALLKAKGIVTLRKEGVKTCYRVVDKKIVELLRVMKN